MADDAPDDPQIQTNESAAEENNYVPDSEGEEEEVAPHEPEREEVISEEASMIFEIEELEQGNPNAKIAKRGRNVFVHYTLKLLNGQPVGSTSEGIPAVFRLGSRRVIEGVNIGVEGMRVGGKRRLVIPPTVGFGSKGKAGSTIPPNSWLLCEIQLVGVGHLT